MIMNSITPETLGNALADAFSQFAGELTAELEDGLSEIGKKTAKKVRSLSPEKSGKYRKGWKVSKEKYRGSFTVTVHNKQYSLVHLLENGHLNRDGTSRARAVPHVAPAQQDAERQVDELLQNL